MTDWWAHRFSSVLLLALVFAPACARASSSFATVTACGARIDVEFRGVPTTRALTRGGGGGETESVSRNDLLNWINSAATAVCGYYGEFPTRHFSLLVKVDGRRGVHSGTTFPRGEGFTRISVGPQTTVGDLKQDWMMTHEMIHLAFPSMADSHHWIEEGIATYVEPVARVQAGELPASDMWRNLVRDMPQGEPQPGDRGLDQTHTWGRTYWGGALFCLLADVQIREQTGNRMGFRMRCGQFCTRAEGSPRIGRLNGRSPSAIKQPEPAFWKTSTAKCETSPTRSTCLRFGRGWACRAPGTAALSSRQTHHWRGCGRRLRVRKRKRQANNGTHPDLQPGHRVVPHHFKLVIKRVATLTRKSVGSGAPFKPSVGLSGGVITDHTA